MEIGSRQMATPSLQHFEGWLIDFDGTLVDTLTVAKKIYCEWLMKYGVSGSEEEFQMINGLTIPQIIDLLCARHGLKIDSVERNEAIEGYKQAFNECMAAPFEGVREFLKALYRAKKRVVIVSSSPLGRIARTVSEQGWGAYIDSIISEGGGKASEQPFLQAIESIHCETGQCVLIEDAPIALATAKRMGLYTVSFGIEGGDIRVDSWFTLLNKVSST